MKIEEQVQLLDRLILTAQPLVFVTRDIDEPGLHQHLAGPARGKGDGIVILDEVENNTALPAGRLGAGAIIRATSRG
jgi:hypothetical protein